MNQLFLFRRQMTPIRKLLLMHLAAGGKLIEYTATGNPMSFVTDVIKPLVSLSTPWTPTQSGTGDPSPTNVRPISGVSGLNVWQTGVNLYNPATRAETHKNSSDANRACVVIPITGCKVTVSGTAKTEGAIPSYNINVGYMGQTGVVYVNNTFFGTSGVINTRTFNLENGNQFVFIYASTSLEGLEADLAKLNIQVEIGETASEYSPYSGTTYPVTFPALGVNQWDEQWVVGRVQSDGSIDETATTRRTTSFIPVLPNATYYQAGPSSALQGRYALYDENKNLTSYVQSGVSSERMFSTGQTARYVRITFGSSYGTTYNHDISINYPATSTAYEPYTNTVYGGSLNLTTGVLTVNRAKRVITSLDTAQKSTTDTTYYYTNVLPDRISADILCDKFKPVIVAKWADLTNYDIGTATSQLGNIRIKYDACTTLEEWNTFVASNPITIIYEISPQTVQLTPQQIQTLIGTNVIWTDTNGTNEAVYLKKG